MAEYGQVVSWVEAVCVIKGQDLTFTSGPSQRAGTTHEGSCT